MAQDRFADDIRESLSRHPRQIPSRYLYDALGSALFEAICRLPWYPLTRAETRLLEAHTRHILRPDVRTVVELGPGSGEKLRALLASSAPDTPLHLHIIDVSRSALDQAARTLERFRQVRVVTHEAP